MDKCPHCDSRNVGKINPPSGSNQVLLTGYNSNTNTVNPTSGIPVEAYGCRNCKSVILKSNMF